MPRYILSHFSQPLKGTTMNQNVIYVQQKRGYGCMSFLGDCFMTVITGGLWMIWIFIREMRRR